MNKKVDLTDMITEDDLPTDLVLLNDIIGIDLTKEIIRKLCGLNIYIQKINSFDRLITNYIKKNRHLSIKELANQISVSEQTVRNYLKKL
jgi:predicted transcriptional regulator